MFFVLDPAVGRRRVDPLRVTPLGTLAFERISYTAVCSRASGWEKEGNPPLYVTPLDPLRFTRGDTHLVTSLFVLDPAVGMKRMNP